MDALDEHAQDHYLVKNTLVDLKTEETVRIAFRKGCSRKIANDFRWSGLHWQDTDNMRAVQRHKSYVVLQGVGGSVERMRRLMTAASDVVRAGALGVHVEFVDIAHSPQAWLELGRDGLEGIHRAFVVTVDGPVTGAYSCGMHNFGLKEVSVPAGVPDRTAVVGQITRHLLVRGARIAVGQTVSIGPKFNSYRFCDVQTVAAPDGSTFQHQVGTWKLICVGGMH